MCAVTALGRDEIIISADSHVSEEGQFWVKRLPAAFRDQAPVFKDRGTEAGGKPGGWDPNERLKEMSIDSVSAEVLYPTLGLRLFGLDDAALQEACFRAYNDWLIDYCSIAPDRLVGLSCISVYDIDHGVAELERTRKAGMKGALIWQAAHPDLPLYSPHYEPLWNAAEELEVPISLHILTGHNYSKGGFGDPSRANAEHSRGSVNEKTLDAVNALYDFIFYGVLERHPRLKLVLVENEIGWIPFFLQQWDYYHHRFAGRNADTISHEPSFYFYRQVYATFFNDAVGGHNLEWWGVDNCMWSNDFPHPNSTWPHSRSVIERDLGRLPAASRAKLVRENVAQLYGMEVAVPA